MTTLAMLCVQFYLAVAAVLFAAGCGGWVAERWPVIVLLVALGFLAAWCL